jgi:aspartate carbamoyltransferase
MSDLKNKDILAAEQFSQDEVWLILKTAEEIEQELETKRSLDRLPGYILATLFYEPSTRTRLSFEAAMHRLGGDVISVAAAKASSSAAKGESLADTARTVEQYADGIVIRHPEIGSAQEMANAASVPVFNAGDGAGQHPTQALLDTYTIWKEHGRLEDLTVALIGDLKHGRTVHSLSTLLSLFDIRLIFVSPAALAMPPEITESLRAKGLEVTESEDLQEAVSQSDVLYVTRIQAERFEDPNEYERLKSSYIVDRGVVEAGKEGMVVMHPLPRVNELNPDVDSLAGAAYFRQMRNGIYVRMALLSLALGE